MSNFHFVLLTVCLVLWKSVRADVYLHNPRGGNNRLDEENRNVQNNKRMFDSQNNNRGGYNVGSLYYYVGSTLQIEWTNQHSCSNPNSHCEIILQYMCDDQLRDGASTNTIPTNPDDCRLGNCNTDKEYGMNENYEYYLNCRSRQRNKGLFIADQNLNNRNRAVNTRQNPNGQRYGYECPEERDYYPYWGPTPWMDIAVLTNDATRCPYYKAESANVKPRYGCVMPAEVLQENLGRITLPNTKEACEVYRYPSNDPNGVLAEWKEVPAFGIEAPDCRETQFSRDNHLGNGIGGHALVFNWTVPNTVHENCAMRIRYNISTGDYNGWNTTYDTDVDAQLADKVGLSENEANQRGFLFENNPEVKVFNDANFELQLAVNTAQFGRTFEDRSFAFAIRPRPASTVGRTISNLNVRGKRGNIVQVYPSVEYDFVPNNLEMGTSNYIHIQWTGSNTNNPNNDGNGQARSDRNNIVQLGDPTYDEGSLTRFGPGAVYGKYGVNYPAHAVNSSFLGLSQEDLLHLAFNSPGHFGGELSQLDDAGTYFDLGLRMISQEGTYHYMCTRNNDFSNRDQKGRITVLPYLTGNQAIGWGGGTLALADNRAKVMVGQGVFATLQTLQMEEWSPEQAVGSGSLRSEPVGDDYASNFVVIRPETVVTQNGATFTIQMQVDPDASNVEIYRSKFQDMASWTKIPSSVNGGTASFQVDQGGVYVARSHQNLGPIIGIAVAGIVLALVVVATIVYFRRNPDRFQKLKSGARKAERSVQNKV
ncbi:protein DD3-3-like [Saccostrea echinata]|uniref:protein DD3-3-like n=1 Tax=Saccostrea echinata TaxID=191078 RepID=UPI002A8095EB|nr:protein DD3-3-like [Saccostrea echinata]